MSHDVREIGVAVIGAFVAGFFGLWNAILEMDILDQVNKKLPPERQYPEFSRTYRNFALRQDYRTLFPDGTLLRRADRVKLVALGIFLGGIALQVFINHAWR